jgi:NDP-sugar pyrophosphorylase family protein
MVPVLGRPFADWQLTLLASQGIERLVYCIGHGGDQLRNHVGDGARFGLQVTWVSDGEELRGTAGALRVALDQDALDEAFFLLYGDSYLRASLRDVADAWRRSRLPALMTVLRNEDRWEASNAIYEDSRVLLYDKSRPEAVRGGMRWIEYGLSVMTRDVIRDMVPAGTVVDLADVMRRLTLEGRVAGYEVLERFYEVGSPQGVQDLEAYLRTLPSSGRTAA